MGMAFVTIAKPAGYPVAAEKGQVACISAESTAPSSVPETPHPATCIPDAQHPPPVTPTPNIPPSTSPTPNTPSCNPNAQHL